MKNNKKDQEKRGIISVVQSPDEVENKKESAPAPTTSTLDKDKQTDEHGIISIVQAPVRKKS